MADRRVHQFDNMAMDEMEEDRYKGINSQPNTADVYERRPPANSGGDTRDFSSTRGHTGTGQVRVLVNGQEWSQAAPGQRRLDPESTGDGLRSGGLTNSVRSDRGLLRSDYLAEINSSRRLNKVNKQSQHSLSSEDLVKLDRFEPIRVSFVDRKQGLEYDAYGQFLGPATPDEAPECIDHQAEPAPHAEYSPPAQEERLATTKAGYSYPDREGNFYPGQDDPSTRYDQRFAGSGWSPAPGSHPPTSFGADSEWQGGTFNPAPTTYPPGFAPRQTDGPKFPNYLPLSIVFGFLFFFPIASIALSFAIQANRLKKSGNYVKALELAKRVLHLNILAVVMGVIGYGVMGFLIWYQTKRLEKLVKSQGGVHFVT